MLVIFSVEVDVLPSVEVEVCTLSEVDTSADAPASDDDSDDALQPYNIGVIKTVAAANIAIFFIIILLIILIEL